MISLLINFRCAGGRGLCVAFAPAAPVIGDHGARLRECPPGPAAPPPLFRCAVPHGRQWPHWRSNRARANITSAP